MESILKFIPSNISGLVSGDIGFLLVLFVVVIGFSFYAGRGSIISAIISFYPASLLYKTFPFLDKVIFLTGDKLIVFNKIGLFLLFLIPITIIVNRFIFSVSGYGGGENMLRLAGLALAFLILVILFSYTTVNYDVFHNFSASFDSLFGVEERQFYWILAPLALLAIL